MSAIIRRIICRIFGHSSTMADALCGRPGEIAHSKQWTYRPTSSGSQDAPRVRPRPARREQAR